MMKKARNLNATVPERGNSMLGTTASMTEMVSWMDACAGSLMGLFDDVMNLLGLGSTDYVKIMNSVMQKGV